MGEEKKQGVMWVGMKGMAFSVLQHNKPLPLNQNQTPSDKDSVLYFLI